MASPFSTKVSLRWPCGTRPGQAKGRSPEAWEPWENRPNDRSQWEEHWDPPRDQHRVPAPPGVVMVSPPTTQRNAWEGRKAKAALEVGAKKRGQVHYQSRAITKDVRTGC